MRAFTSLSAELGEAVVRCTKALAESIRLEKIPAAQSASCRALSLLFQGANFRKMPRHLLTEALSCLLVSSAKERKTKEKGRRKETPMYSSFTCGKRKNQWYRYGLWN